MLEYRVILLLRSTAGLLALAALALLLRPGKPIELLGLTSSRELEWSFRLVGIGNLGMAALLTLAAAFLGERGLRQAAAILLLISAATFVLTIFLPGGWGLWHLLLLIFEVTLVSAYFFALKGRRRNR